MTQEIYMFQGSPLERAVNNIRWNLIDLQDGEARSSESWNQTQPKPLYNLKPILQCGNLSEYIPYI
jgi:hypothetical protein